MLDSPGPVPFPALPPAPAPVLEPCRFSEDLVRKMLLGQSLVFARVVPQQFAVLVKLSHASTTRSVLRKWEIWSFIVSRLSGCGWGFFWWEVCGRVGGLAIECWVRGRLVAHSALSCSIEALRVLRVCAGAVEGLLGVLVLMLILVLLLTDRLGMKGRESFLVSRDGVRSGDGLSVLLGVAPTRALHDLARLSILGTMLFRLEGLGPLGSVRLCSATRVSSRFREAGRGLGLDNGSRGSGFSDARRPGVPGPGLLAKSLCRTDMDRVGALLAVLMSECCKG